MPFPPATIDRDEDDEPSTGTVSARSHRQRRSPRMMSHRQGRSRQGAIDRDDLDKEMEPAQRLKSTSEEKNTRYLATLQRVRVQRRMTGPVRRAKSGCTTEERVNQCLRNACFDSKKPSCLPFVDCGSGNFTGTITSPANWTDWLDNPNASACFFKDGGFEYGIYQQVVNLTTKHSVVTRYVYSLFWGFQQISTLAGSLVPSYFEWEVLFTMSIIGLGLLLFALLIGNMQNFLLALGRRRLEMQLRRRDVEQWMSHRRLPEELRRKVKQAERFSWAATRGVNEEELLENLPEDLQRDIWRHFFNFLKKVRLFSLMDEPVLDAIFAKLRQTLYIRGSDILYQGSPIDKMVFIVRGKLESIGADGNVSPLSESDVCGEELLAWCLERSANKDGWRANLSGQRLFSNRTVRCLTNVEAFALRVADLEEVTVIYARFLRNPRVQGAIRYESPYWRHIAATRIQVAWRYRQRRLRRASAASASSMVSSVRSASRIQR